MTEKYRFPGIRKFIEQYAGHLHHADQARLGGDWLLSRIRDQLAQLPEAPEHAQHEMLDRAQSYLRSLHAACLVAEAMIDEVAAACFPGPNPEQLDVPVQDQQPAEPDRTLELENMEATEGLPPADPGQDSLPEDQPEDQAQEDDPSEEDLTEPSSADADAGKPPARPRRKDRR